MSTITLAEAETGCPWRPGRRLRPEPAPVATRSDDEHLAFLLVTTWSLRTGRRLRHAPPEQLTEAELLEFWSDPEYGRSPAAPAPVRRNRPPSRALNGATGAATSGPAAAGGTGGRS